MKIKYLLLLLFIINNPLVSEEINSDRPGFTDPPNVIQSGTIQIETGALLEMYTLDLDGTDVNAEVMSLPSTLFRVGVFSFMELRLASAYSKTTFDMAVDDIETTHFSAYDVSLKFNILDGGFALGILTGCKLHNANLGGETEVLNPYLIFAAAHGITNKWSMGYNAGIQYGVSDLEVDDFNKAFWSVSSNLKINDKVEAFVELYYELARHFNYNFIYDNGITYKVSDNVQLDFSLGTSFLERYNFYSCGVSWWIK